MDIFEDLDAMDGFLEAAYENQFCVDVYDDYDPDEDEYPDGEYYG